MTAWRAFTLAAIVLLAACQTPAPVKPVPVPPRRPASLEKPVPARPDPQKSEVARYYQSIQDSFLTRGLMRTDGGGKDAPFGTRQVVDAFLNVALYAEYADRGDRLVAEATASKLQRWDRPVRMEVMSGDSVPARTAARERAEVARYAAQLSRATGHPVSTVTSNGNFLVAFLSEDERRAFGPQLNRLMPGLSSATREAIINMTPSTYCLVVTRDAPGRDTYSQAVAVIRAEHPDLLRLSCIHEELAQGLGLANDDPRARPSIFNDDEEFATLTKMDEILLKILYDPRLQPGMTEAEAKPIVETIAEEIMGGPS